MLWKSLLTGTILAGLAGAVVYFGTGGEFATASVKDDLRQAVTETKSAAKSVTEDVSKTASETIEKMTDASESIQDSVTDRMASGAIDEPPKTDSKASEKDETKKKWLDRYLNKKTDAQSSETKRQEQAPVDVDDIESGDVDSAVKDILKKDREAASENDRLEKERESKNTPRLEARPNIESPTDLEIESVYQTAMAETKDIKIIELRDRAYLSLIDYTIRKKDFERSKAVISEISQPELRDTARSNIAVGLARLGQREAAFAILENVETQALADVLRLQVIEAMTAPTENSREGAIPTN